MAVIQFTDVLERRLLPIDAQDVVTKARLVIAGNRAGAEPTNLRAGRVDQSTLALTSFAYAALPITRVFEAPEHATYAAERAFSLPDGVNPFLPPTDPAVPEPLNVNGFTNPGSPSAIRDGDFATFASLDASLGSIQYYLDDTEVYGYLLVYSRGGPGEGTVTIGYSQGIGDPEEAQFSVSAQAPLPSTFSGEATPEVLSQAVTQYLVLPTTASFAPENNAPGDIVGPHRTRLTLFTGDATAMRVIAFYPLILDEALLEDIARSSIRLPADLPQRITVRGYVPPDRVHTIVGWPGGDLTAAVAQHQYELRRGEVLTVIDVEQAGAPIGLPAEAMEAARERRIAVRADIRTASYGLMMGERQ